MLDYDDVSHDSGSVPASLPERNVTFREPGPLVVRPQPRLFSESRKLVAASQSKDDRPLRVDPGEIRFESIEPGVLYVMSFSVRNATKAAQRIRIRAPKSGFFALNYIPAGAVAPGIDLRAEIECQLPAGGSQLRFLDSIVVTMGQHSLEVPLYASKPSASIVFPALCNLGYVAEGQPVTVRVPFENKGQVTSSITFNPPVDSRIKLNPTKLDLQPGDKTNVIVSFEGRELGPWREFVQVNGTGMLDPAILDVTVQVVDQKLNLLAANNGGIMESVEFGALFYGQSKVVDALLVNTGPQQLSFAVSYDDEMGGNPQTEDGSGAPPVPPLEKLMTISPAQGIIKPFSQVAVKIKFNPILPAPVKGFVTQFSAEAKEVKFATRRAMIDCPEMVQRLNLNMTGSASSPSVAVSPLTLRFGACAVYDRRDILVTLNNKSASKTTFEFSHLAHFKCSVEKGELQAYQSLSVVMSFTPTQLGVFKNVIQLSLAGGLEVIDLKILADADQPGKRVLVGGLDKLPEDFQKTLKFVDPEEIAAMKKAKKQGKKIVSGTSEAPFHPLQDDKTFFSNSSSKLRDEIYGLSSGKDDIDVTEHENPFMARQEHNRTYNQYLQSSHTQRLDAKRTAAHRRLVMRGGSDREDPFGVDMGIERGLEEPELKVPRGGEPLWLANRNDGPGGGGRSRVPLDENRLIQKKWPNTPATQAEMRDCASEISLEDLALVQPSHRTIDFGKVCVGSISAKSFCITNDLNQSVLVKVDDFEPESRQSKPDSQIVPAGAVAGFDVYFTSKILGKYKKTFSYKINGLYTYKVYVAAETVPIELEMNKSELVMEFPDDSLEPSLAQDLFLKNPGNAVADFLWGSSGAFVCKPDKGSINPGQVAIISIVWTPSIEKRNKEELALNVTGGLDKTLSVTGIVKEVKAAFVEKKISFGTVAVGVENKLKATISNTGTNSCVFFVDPLDDKLGVRITPEKGVIPPGETVRLEVSVTPKVAMSYDNAQGLTVSIRGGKPISIKFSGESVIPSLEMKETEFVMGPVAVGSEYRLPFTLVNKSSIAASMILDLTSYQDFKPSISVPKAYAEITHEQYDNANTSILIIKPTEDGSLSPNSLKKLNSWRIKIAPGSTLRGSLVLAPTVAKKYNFKLPLSLQGLDGMKSFAVTVTGEAITSKLTISSQMVDFGDRVVSRDPLSRATYYLEVAFRSLDLSKGFSYEIKDNPEDGEPVSSADDGIPPLFFISPVRGDLAPNSSTPVRVTFQPQTSGNFSKRLQIYITGQPDPDRPYYTLLCRGSAVFPRMTFSKSNLQLPPVPLGTTSRAAFTIFNNGYSSLKIKHKVSPAITVPLDISFPDGDEFGITVDSIKVVISAKVDTPSSWAGKIEFLDNDGERFVVNVCGCSENNLLTNFPFVKSYASDYGFLGLESQPVQFLRKTEIAELRAQDARRKELLRKQRALERQGKTAAGGSVSSTDSKKKKNESVVDDTSMLRIDESLEGVDPDKDIDLSFNNEEAALVLKWLNRNICRVPFDEERFPHCITETFGDAVVDCIEQLSGKKIGVKPGAEADEAPGSGVPGSRRSDRGDSAAAVSPAAAKLATVNRIVAKYQAIINYLVKSGALLTHINPVSLLGLEDHLVAQEQELKKIEGNRFTINVLSDATKIWTEAWLEGCKAGWIEIIFQSIKIFTLSRVTYAYYSSMPGVHLAVEESSTKGGGAKEDKAKKGSKKGPAQVPPEFAKSNVYSQAECVLLAWLAYHMHHASNLEDSGADPVNAESRLVGINKRLCDFDGDLRTLFPFLQTLHSHLPESTKYGSPLYGYTMLDKTKEGVSFNPLVAALDSARLLFDFSEEELTSSGRALVLLALHLFLNLPSLLPKAKVEFKGTVGSTITKTIELKNPSKKKVKYNVTLQGSGDFSVMTKELVLNPESTADFQVTLKARFFEPVSAVITFWGVREAGVAGSTMVFQLVSSMTSRKPEFSVKRSVSLFDMETIPLPITSPFPKDCVLPVRTLQHFAPLSVEEALKGNAVNPKARGVPTGSALAGDAPNSRDRDAPKVVVDEEKEIEKLFKNPFWCSEESAQFVTGGTKVLAINVLPFQMGVHTCHVIFLDPNMGEFCYEIVLEVGLPKSSEKLEFTALRDGSTAQRKLQFSSKNVLFEKALTNITDVRLTNPSKKGKARSVLTGLVASTGADEQTGATPFVVDINSPYFNCSKEISFISEYLVLGGAGHAATSGRPDTQGNKFKKVQKTSLEAVTPQDVQSPGFNTTIVSFTPDRAGTYSARIAVLSKSNKSDIRILDVNVAVGMPNVKLVLEFKGPARQKLCQDIPIQNESGRDWHLQASVSGRGFAGPASLSIPRGDKASYPLTFTGPYAGSFEGTLVLVNKDGEHNDKFEYALIGSAEEPLAEEHLHFKCKARTRQTLSIPVKAVPRPSGSGPFEVQTDLPYVTGPSFLDLGGSGATYEFSVLCPIGGVLSGSISFTDPSGGATIWYTVDIEVTAPLPESTIEVRSTARKAVAVEISLENPTKETLVFQVTTDGEGLLGDTVYSLPASNAPNAQSSFYELIYSPLIEGDFVGKISFFNEVVGEFWYKLHLTADAAPPTVLELMECMVGGTKVLSVPIENPLSEEVTLTVISSDPDHFFVPSDSIVLGPYAQSSFPLHFRPSSLTDLAYGELTLSHTNFGSLQFRASGKGLLPGVMPTAQVFAPLNELGSCTIAFRNPFSNALPVDIVLSEEGGDDSYDGEGNTKGFSLLLRKTEDLVIPAKSPLQISVGFCPKRLGEYNSTVNIRSNIGGRSLLWCFPIVGMAEAGSPQLLDVIKTPCKTSTLIDVDVFLKGLRIADLYPGDVPTAAEFSLQILVDDKNKPLVARSFRAQPIELITLPETDAANATDFVMRYRLLFEPLRTFISTIEMLVESKNRGRWRVQTELEATEPEPDDTISLVAAVGGTDKVSFRLSNRFLGFSTFQAYFTVKSSPHFSVSPTSGVLAPYGSDGTSFVVSFAPNLYGLKEIGTLVIVTEDAQWSYEVTGSYPAMEVGKTLLHRK